jgi:hypothetical protein
VGVRVCVSMWVSMGGRGFQGKQKVNK